jgi:ATP-dependent Lhr-like helicase
VDDELLDPLLEPGADANWLDPAAIGRTEDRLRSSGRPPRSADEMAETLHRLGDLAPSELAGPMLGFLEELGAQGRARTIELAGTTEPSRWIGAEESGLYATAFDDSARGSDAALETIVHRYLRTHALIGLADLSARYPIDPAQATDLLERWSESGRAVRLDSNGVGEMPRWADRQNLSDLRRLSIALRRRESVAVRPEVFADFVARRQHVHPEARLQGAAAVVPALELLQGFAAPADLWESELLPRRVRDYRGSWLDEVLATGGWLWRAEGDGKGAATVAFAPREFAGTWPSPEQSDEAPSDPAVEPIVLEHLSLHGASFATDVSRALGIEPSRTRRALRTLLCRGLVTNDRFDPLRAGAESMAEALAEASSAPTARRVGLGRLRPHARRSASARPEGRWSRLASPDSDPETALLAWAEALLARYGVLARETAALDPWAPAWRALAPLLARAELRGEIRRGYFVEGLSGVQYATDEAARELAQGAAAREPSGPLVLISTLDPANLYGSGAAFDIPLLEGGTARLPRSPGNALVLAGGRPILIIEALGKRLTGLASASAAELRAAVALLPSLATPARRVLKVETYNTAPTLASPAAPWLAALGFVRDHPGMAYYAGW